MDITELDDNCIYRSVTKVRTRKDLCVVHFDHSPTGTVVERETADALIAQAEADGKLLGKRHCRAWKRGPWQYVYSMSGNKYGQYFSREVGQLEKKPLQLRPFIEQPVRNKRAGGLRWEVVSS